jgi:hypothetical protein
MTLEQKINEVRNSLVNDLIYQADHQEKIEQKYGINSDAARYQAGCTKGYREALRLLAKIMPEDFNAEYINALIK